MFLLYMCTYNICIQVETTVLGLSFEFRVDVEESDLLREVFARHAPYIY